MISYDISNNKKRTRFAKYLSKFGHRLQFSVFEIDNGPRVLTNIVADINNKFAKDFEQCDSVYIFQMSQTCQIQRFGYARNENKDLIIIN